MHYVGYFFVVPAKAGTQWRSSTFVTLTTAFPGEPA